jgi:uncharacterized protein with FMN-binding domain
MGNVREKPGHAGQQATKKVIVSFLIVGFFVLYSFIHARSSSAVVLPPAPADASPAAGTATTAGSAPETPSASGTLGGQYKDGTYTGAQADAQWGYVQIKAVIQNGKISSVQFVQYPNDRERSVLINQYADPQLDSEAIQAQSAQVDIVTGATDTSYAFMQSLGDALSQAQG